VEVIIGVRCGFPERHAGLIPKAADTGASQLIIDGKIKLKNDSQIKAFTENGLLFENGSELQADVVVFCTGSVFLLKLRLNVQPVSYFFVLDWVNR